ncbi:MAG: hypothetical protein VXX85_05725 [Candidatus Margulisiibacteriota bacterium]|nr:hypothetical protein [Candidatus Margulisiibacteriota bacterium]
MSFLKNIFGINSNKKQTRTLNHPNDLREGDIIKFRYLNIAEISEKEFEVSQINTYIYDDLCYPELVLKDCSNNVIFMLVNDEDGEEYLALSTKLDRTKISSLIEPNIMKCILDGKERDYLDIFVKPHPYEDWLTTYYQKVNNNILGSYVKGDARYLSDAELNKRQSFTSYIFEDDSSGEYAIEIEAYKTGEVEVSLTRYFDIKEIEELWPKKINDVKD